MRPENVFTDSENIMRLQELRTAYEQSFASIESDSQQLPDLLT